MMVSRQAITKWEADKGIPDVSNLKLLAQLLNVSVDYLLDDGVEIDINVIRETIDLSKYGKAVIKKKLTNKLMLDRYPDAEIRTLMPEKKRDKVDKAVDTVICVGKRSLRFFLPSYAGPFGDCWRILQPKALSSATI